MELKSKCESLDTNIILRIVLDGDRTQKATAIKLVLAHRKSFFIDDSVVSECVYVLEKIGYSRKDISGMLVPLFQNKIFLINHHIFDQVFPFYLEHPSLSFEDCYLNFRIAEKHAAPLWTFDKKFANQSTVAKIPK